MAADLQRPNAVDQLRVVGQQAGVPVFAPEPGNGIGDPVDVARAAFEHATSAQHDIVIIDTAGRLAIDADSWSSCATSRTPHSPTKRLLVVDAMIGQDASTTADNFASQSASTVWC